MSNLYKICIPLLVLESQPGCWESWHMPFLLYAMFWTVLIQIYHMDIKKIIINYYYFPWMHGHLQKISLYGLVAHHFCSKRFVQYILFLTLLHNHQGYCVDITINNQNHRLTVVLHVFLHYYFDISFFQQFCFWILI